jgi:acyl-CoA thioesterase FadM
MAELKLYLVHCGFYDDSVGDGIFEGHTNFMVAAESFEDARARVKMEPGFKDKKMHVDGLVCVDAVNGFRVDLTPDPALEGRTELTSYRHRDLAPKKA